MALEIERKFLVIAESWRETASEGVLYWQGYIGEDEDHNVRIRIAGEKAFLTIKSAPLDQGGLSRMEFEYEIPVADAKTLLEKMCLPGQIRKKRYRIPFSGVVWEVDEFFGENAGLVLAEIELREQNQKIELPDWVGTEVSNDIRYTNARLAKNPYGLWGQTTPARSKS